jgi:uncharacterized protein YnzC (UPF0291/DUF896 family)
MLKQIDGVMSRPKRKLTAAEKKAKKKRREEYMTIFVGGKQKRVKRPPTIEGMDVDEFIRRNADPIWLVQNEMWEVLYEREEEERLRMDDCNAMEDFDTDPDSIVDEENRRSLKRRDDFRFAADFIAEQMKSVPEVVRIKLFGSVAGPLELISHKFQKHRHYGKVFYREVGDLDLAVWLTGYDSIETIQSIRNKSSGLLYSEKGIGIAHHQIEIFIFYAITNEYIGRICIFSKCPNAGKKECRVEGCGAIRHVRKHEEFSLYEDALSEEKSVVLFEREQGGGFFSTIRGEEVPHD